MKCQNCGYENENGVNFCIKCGTKMPEQKPEPKAETRAVPKPEAEIHSVECPSCKNYFNVEFGVCPFCGNIYTEEAQRSIMPKKEELKKKKTIGKQCCRKYNRKWILPISVIAVIMVSIGLFILFYILKTPKLTKEEIAVICEELDYAGLTATVESYVDQIEDTYLFDADKDGQKELFIRNKNELYQEKDNVLAFETSDHPLFASAVQNGAAGFADIACHGDELRLSWGYATIGNFYSCVEEWTNSGWKILSETEGTEGDEAAYDGMEEDDIADGDVKNIGRVGYQTLTSRYFEARNKKEILAALKEHIKNTENTDAIFWEEDIDEDGKEEYLYIVPNFAEPWSKQTSYTGTDEDFMKDAIAGAKHFGTVVYFADTTWNSVVIHTIHLTENLADAMISHVTYKDNVLLFEAVSEFDQVSVCEFFTNAKQYKKVNRGSREEWEKMVDSYIDFQETYYYQDVSVKYADVCEAEGDELVCICNKNDVNKVGVYAFYCGRPILLYEQEIPEYDTNISAVYLSEVDDREQLLLYSQGRFHHGRRGADTFDYFFVRYDEYYQQQTTNRNLLIMYDDEVPDDNDKKYFAKLKEILSDAVVCSEPYNVAESEFFDVDGR